MTHAYDESPAVAAARPLTVAAPPRSWEPVVITGQRPAPKPERRRLAGLDGLRAVAVLAVVAFHLDYSLAPGGFLGVDVFFVISGLLITNLIATEILETGRLRLGRFYAAPRPPPAAHRRGDARGGDDRRHHDLARPARDAAERRRRQPDLRHQLVADRRRPVLLRVDRPPADGAAPVVAGDRGAVLPRLVGRRGCADRRSPPAASTRSHGSGWSRSSRCCSPSRRR